ncbi:MAG: hypothetical protein KatS3mg108_1628 [Isosphaeraceae bacterium]|nr:MAG: hypothetical protein KatS3mg108_1628 [Isosphaeraceae bacterium]
MDASLAALDRRETRTFALVLAGLVAVVLRESLFLGRILSPADVIYAQPGFDQLRGKGYVPSHRLLMDPFLQFEPWLEWSRAELRAGRWPLWNPLVGCGAPHLANGQSAVFDPFHLIAYLGELPDARAWMAAARLWFAGVGMFLLARGWGLPTLGRWFAGLAYPFCGFVVVWLLYPPAASAVWLPWMLWAATRLLDRRSPETVAALAGFTAGSIFGGHIQTAAHNLLATAAYAGWRIARERSAIGSRLAGFGGAVALGAALAAIQIVPLAAYLSRSPVWTDREREHAGPLGVRPRPLDAVCTALPLIYGSQRRGQPNLARALGVHNLNESAGGFAGLATLIWLAPLGWSQRRQVPVIRFLGALVLVSAAVAFGVPPLAQLAQAPPVLQVMDHRRLVHLVALGLILLGGFGLDQRATARAARRFRVLGWSVAAMLVVAAAAVPLAGEAVREVAWAHYRKTNPPGRVEARAERQIADLMAFLPPYLALSGLQLGVIGWLAGRGERRPGWLAAGLALLDLATFGAGHNPAIARGDYKPRSALIDHLCAVASPPRRILALDPVLPPNTLMRYGLADVRNYDSIETDACLRALGPLFEPDPERGARTSRRRVTWERAAACRNKLERAGVAAVVGSTPPPDGLFEHVEAVAGCWVARLHPTPAIAQVGADGKIRIDAPILRDQAIDVPVTYDPGWRVETNSLGSVRVVEREGFLAVVASGPSRTITLRYDPVEFRVGMALTLAALVTLVARLAPSLGRPRRDPSV